MTVESQASCIVVPSLGHYWPNFKGSNEPSSAPILHDMARPPKIKAETRLDKNFRRNAQYLLDGLYPDKKDQARKFERDHKFPRSTLRRILSGNIAAKLEQVVMLAEALGRDPFELLADDISRPQERTVAASSTRRRVRVFSEGQGYAHRPDTPASKPRRS